LAGTVEITPTVERDGDGYTCRLKSMVVGARAVETGHMSASRLHALIRSYVEPVLVRAGFAEGQWADERGGLADPACSVIFCASAIDTSAATPT
jgi:hypothetical protein